MGVALTPPDVRLKSSANLPSGSGARGIAEARLFLFLRSSLLEWLVSSCRAGSNLKVPTMFDKRTLVSFYLKSGQVIQLRFKHFSVTLSKDGSIHSWEYQGESKSFVIPLESVSAIVFEN